MRQKLPCGHTNKQTGPGEGTYLELELQTVEAFRGREALSLPLGRKLLAF